ncbi:MAG: hypothetical protein ACI4LX_01205, partial [Treponema sp.]
GKREVWRERPPATKVEGFSPSKKQRRVEGDLSLKETGELREPPPSEKIPIIFHKTIFTVIIFIILTIIHFF